jgi:hypothetical protein
MHCLWSKTLSWAGALAVLLHAVSTATGQEAVWLRERFPSGYLYQVSSRVELSGSLTLPLEKGQTTAKKVAVTGKSALEYEERVLSHGKNGEVDKSIRVYGRLSFDRKVAEQLQQGALRPTVRRLVILRHKQLEVPFSPDGPLTWAEIDMVRTDVFTPALAGLLPDRAVRPGDRWDATPTAVQELTDLERIEEGGLSCKLTQLTTLDQRRHARVEFTGTVRGLGEDGPSRQQLNGYLFFDLESNHLSYLSMRGVHYLIGKDGKANGQVEGSFVLTRQPVQSRELNDASLRGVAVEPNEDNTLLLYEDSGLGVRLLYPRRWRLAGVRGRQLGLDENRGSGLLLTLEPLSRVPSGRQFLQESRDWLTSQKATVLREDGPRRLQELPQALENFTLDVEANRQRFQMNYFVIQQANGGGTIAARLLSADIQALQRDVERIARSVQITRKQ